MSKVMFNSYLLYKKQSFVFMRGTYIIVIRLDSHQILTQSLLCSTSATTQSNRIPDAREYINAIHLKTSLLRVILVLEIKSVHKCSFYYDFAVANNIYLPSPL